MEITKRLIQNNYTVGRFNHSIKRIILHTYAGGGTSLYNWFNRESTDASAHYAVMYSGAVEQYVEDANMAWHAGTTAGNGLPNNNWESIGIEHQDNNDPASGGRTNELYESSAQLVAMLCKKYNIPCRLLSEGEKWGNGIALHRYYANKSCPGGLDANRIIARANQIISASETPGWKKGWEKKEEQFAPQKEYKLYSIIDGSVVQTYQPEGKKVGTMYVKAGWRMTQWSYENNKPNAFKVGELEWKPEPQPKDVWEVKLVNGMTTTDIMRTESENDARVRFELEGAVGIVQLVKNGAVVDSRENMPPVEPKPTYEVKIVPVDPLDTSVPHKETYDDLDVAKSAYSLGVEIAKEIAKQYKKDMQITLKKFGVGSVDVLDQEVLEYDEVPNVEYHLKYYPYQGVTKVAMYADYKQALDKFNELSNQLKAGDKLELLENGKLLNSYSKPMERPENIHKTIGDHLRSTVEIAAPVQAVTTFVGVIFAYYNPNMPMGVVLAFTGLFGIAFNVAYIVVSKWLNQ